MDDTAREILQFFIGGLALLIAGAEFIRRYLREKPQLKFTVTGAAEHTKVQQDYYIHQIQIRLTNQSRLDNSVSECWLQFRSQTARPPTHQSTEREWIRPSRRQGPALRGGCWVPSPANQVLPDASLGLLLITDPPKHFPNRINDKIGLLLLNVVSACLSHRMHCLRRLPQPLAVKVKLGFHICSCDAD